MGSARVRLQKFLADCGLGSRRACEALIEAGRVSINGERVTRQGHTLDPDTAVVELDGRRVMPDRKRYILFNKPHDILCTSSDPAGRRTWRDCVRDVPVRLFTVGRLDRNSEGLLLLTNDGDFAYALTHPKHGVAKVYEAVTERALTAAEERRFLGGIESDGETLRVASLRSEAGGRYTLVLHEGRNRHIRRMFEAVGVRVLKLKRRQVGDLKLGRLRPGAWRDLKPHEVEALLRTAAE